MLAEKLKDLKGDEANAAAVAEAKLEEPAGENGNKAEAKDGVVKDDGVVGGPRRQAQIRRRRAKQRFLQEGRTRDAAEDFGSVTHDFSGFWFWFWFWF